MISNWSHINTEKYNETPELFETLRALYGENGLLNIDLYIGGRRPRLKNVMHLIYFCNKIINALVQFILLITF